MQFIFFNIFIFIVSFSAFFIALWLIKRIKAIDCELKDHMKESIKRKKEIEQHTTNNLIGLLKGLEELEFFPKGSVESFLNAKNEIKKSEQSNKNEL